MEVLDPGHMYKLSTLDGDVDVVLTFVKRNTPAEHYPGNDSAYPGTTLQEAIRACLNRLRYVDNQYRAPENMQVECGLQMALAGLERRAARIHGRDTWFTAEEAEFGPFCPKCGHIGHTCEGGK